LTSLAQEWQIHMNKLYTQMERKGIFLSSEKFSSEFGAKTEERSGMGGVENLRKGYG
jgi:hypothetical protein